MTHIWNKSAKPSGTSWKKITKSVPSGQQNISAGMPIGFLLALTYSTASVTPGINGWTKITKASGTSWTKITKAT